MRNFVNLGTIYDSQVTHPVFFIVRDFVNVVVFSILISMFCHILKENMVRRLSATFTYTFTSFACDWSKLLSTNQIATVTITFLETFVL